MFNILTLTTIENKSIVSGVRMVGVDAEVQPDEIKINEYRPDLMGCELVNDTLINEAGEVVHVLEGAQGE